MTKNIIIDLGGIKDKLNLMDHIATHATGMQRVNDQSPTNWDAFDDDLCCFDIKEFENIEEKKINLIFSNWKSFQAEFSKEYYDVFLDILLKNTDSTERVDGYDFTFQIRLEKY